MIQSVAETLDTNTELHPRQFDPDEFVANAERITNQAIASEWEVMYHPNAVFEIIADGAYERYDGSDQIRAEIAVQCALWRKHGLQVHKHLECASSDTLVQSWRGGFEGEDRQFGIEIWTLCDGLVTRHQMYLFQKVLPSRSLLAKARVLLTSPRIGVSI